MNDLCIKWSHHGPVVADFGTPVLCERCDRPVGGEPEPCLFRVGTWRRVCDECGATEDPQLTKTLWNIRAELDRQVVGHHMCQWLDTLEPVALRQVTVALTAAGVDMARDAEDR